MVNKNATVSYRIDKGGMSFPLTIRKDDNFDYTDEELDAKLEHSYQQVLRREGTPIKEIIAKRRKGRANA